MILAAAFVPTGQPEMSQIQGVWELAHGQCWRMVTIRPKPNPSCRPAPEARQIVAHGETVGIVVKPSKPQRGRQKTNPRESLSPHPGLDSILFVHPRFHRGLLSSVAPRLPNAIRVNSPNLRQKSGFNPGFSRSGGKTVGFWAAQHPCTAIKIPCLVIKKPCLVIKIPFLLIKKPFLVIKKPFLVTKLPFLVIKKPCLVVKIPILIQQPAILCP
jgi:hypothetical protein